VKLQAGSYKLDADKTLMEVFEKTLTKPTYDDLTITILPGWNIYDIDASLAEKKITKT
jgi:cell division protein YceG involved in septum cleavage